MAAGWGLLQGRQGETGKATEEQATYQLNEGNLGFPEIKKDLPLASERLGLFLL